ncbi:hypothetical protein [Intestinimonas sp. HCP28S3_D6]|uniref:hypothetical protein n=1 Tax=Intestinimonas sp. HCP28S3_D6 TaxID=3438942 RepID=UPI003F89B36E
MAALVAEFFGIIGVDMVPPSNLAELIPYLLTVVVGVALVSGVFGVIGKLAEVLLNFRRW